MVYEPAVSSGVPPVDAWYQTTVPAEVVALSLTVPGPQRETSAALEIVGIEYFVAVTIVLGDDLQPFVPKAST